MTTLPSRLREILTEGLPHGTEKLPVRRVWPDIADPTSRYTLECSTPDGAVAAVLDADGARLLTDAETAETLPHLRTWQHAGGRVLAHRAHKRAVLAMPDGSFVKLAKRSATRRALSRATTVDGLLDAVAGAPRRPTVLDHRADEGWLRLAPAGGAPLEQVLDDADPRRIRMVAQSVATALTALAGVSRGDAASRSLAAGLVRHDLPLHTGLREAEILRSWTNAAALAAPAGVLKGDQTERLQRRGAELAARLENVPALRPDIEAGAPAAVLAHRDLHEGQILTGVGEGGDPPVTVLDWDTAAWTHPALDAANLLAHVQRGAALRDAAGWHLFEESLVWALADRGHPAVSTREGREVLALLRDAARLRVFAVHAFRPGSLDLAALTDLPAPEG